MNIRDLLSLLLSSVIFVNGPSGSGKSVVQEVFGRVKFKETGNYFRDLARKKEEAGAQNDVSVRAAYGGHFPDSLDPIRDYIEKDFGAFFDRWIEAYNNGEELPQFGLDGAIRSSKQGENPSQFMQLAQYFANVLNQRGYDVTWETLFILMQECSWFIYIDMHPEDAERFITMRAWQTILSSKDKNHRIIAQATLQALLEERTTPGKTDTYLQCFSEKMIPGRAPREDDIYEDRRKRRLSYYEQGGLGVPPGKAIQAMCDLGMGLVPGQHGVYPNSQRLNFIVIPNGPKRGVSLDAYRELLTHVYSMIQDYRGSCYQMVRAGENPNPESMRGVRMASEGLQILREAVTDYYRNPNAESFGLVIKKIPNHLAEKVRGYDEGYDGNLHFGSPQEGKTGLMQLSIPFPEISMGRRL